MLQVMKKIFIIAGPNGAGKTTFAREFLPQEAACPVFVNADLIAAGLSPFQPEAAAFAAGRLMLDQIDHHVRRNQSFAFETTLAGRTYVQQIAKWRAAGYFVELFFLALDNPHMAAARVEQRVRQGGHSIDTPVIERRFFAGLHNLKQLYAPAVNRWSIYDNSGEIPLLLETGENP
jgi:predicted ABC-type ATPase